MENTETITIPIDPESLKALQERAERQGTTPIALLQEIVREELSSRMESNADDRREAGLKAHRELDKIVESQRLKGFDPMKAVQLVRKGWEKRTRKLESMTGEERKQAALEALADLRAYRESLPESAAVDVGQLILEGREQLNERIPI